MNKLAASVVVVLLVAGSALLLQARGEQPATAPATQPDGDGVVTPSGLQIETLTPGTGAARGDAIFVHYAGRLTDGTQFDSSYDRGEPISLILGQGQVIAGWEEGLLGMQVGEKRRLTIPPNLAYGAEGRPPKIPPNATLVFEVELVGLQRR